MPETSAARRVAEGNPTSLTGFPLDPIRKGGFILLLLHPHNNTAMKAIASYSKPNTISSPTTSRFQTSNDEDDRKTQMAFYFFAGLLVLALLYFVILTFFL